MYVLTAAGRKCGEKGRRPVQSGNEKTISGLPYLSSRQLLLYSAVWTWKMGEPLATSTRSVRLSVPSEAVSVALLRLCTDLPNTNLRHYL
jgi:hypothetical protein